VSDIVKKMGIVPPFIQSFVEQQKTIRIETLLKDSSSPLFPYAEYWRRAVAAMLLSGRIASKYNDFPNITKVRMRDIACPQPVTKILS
jgi:hypothetical protein